VGKVPGGGIVEYSPATELPSEEVGFVLSQPDFTTAGRICEAINKKFSNKIAVAYDASLVKVKIPQEWQGERLVEFISTIQDLTIIPEVVAKVVINERTGTIVMGSDVRISPVAVAHGGLIVTVKTTPVISQPPPFSPGETKVEKEVEVKAEEEKFFKCSGSYPKRYDSHISGLEGSRSPTGRTYNYVIQGVRDVLS